MKTILTLSAILFLGTLSGFAQTGENKPGEKHPTTDQPGDIVAVAAATSNLSTLVAAIKAADLVETLQGDGPFTVFAPTNDAFAKLPAGAVEDLMKPENKEKLVSILTYHVVPGKVMAADVKTMQAKSVNGAPLDIKVEDTTVMVNKSTVTGTDIAASNGVIHLVDTVLMP